MDFLDEYEDRPRFIFQSRPVPSPPTIDSPPNSPKNKPLVIISLTLSLLFLASSFFFIQSQIIQSLTLWISLSLLVGPFAPLSLTGGDVHVGQGRVVEFLPQDEPNEVDESKKKLPNKRNKAKRSDLEGVSSIGSFDFAKKTESLECLGVNSKEKDDVSLENASEEREWTEDELGLLRKQIVKHPVGKPRRWEVIAEAFKSNHSVESVINKAKSLGKEKPADSDSYSKFLKDRKPVDKRVEDGDGEVVGNESSGEVISWSSSEDIALLNAMKVFTKDVAMRWDKIAAAVPGKSKAACMKRVSELKKEFRSSKASSES